MEALEKTKRTIVGTVALYEVVALIVPGLPTITSIFHWAREHPVGRWVLIGPIWVWLSFHLFTDDHDKCPNCLGVRALPKV